MEEKKLTDEIVDILTDFDEYGFQATVTMPNAEEHAKDWKNRLIDLFHRLQDESANQKAEIKRLEKDVHDMSWLIKIHKYCVGADHCQNSSMKEFKLQKQVDELKKDLRRSVELLKEGGELAKMNNQIITQVYQQAVKDTAKEIWEDCIDEIMRGCGDDKEFWVMKILIETFKKYGVGVEVE